MEDLFKLNGVGPIEMKTMPPQEFLSKTKSILEKILFSYSANTSSIKLSDDEYPDESVCSKCQGCGTFTNLEGEEKECTQDREEGECYYRFLDYEGFALDVESKFEDMCELLCVDEIIQIHCK